MSLLHYVNIYFNPLALFKDKQHTWQQELSKSSVAKAKLKWSRRKKQNSLSILPVPFECRVYYRQESLGEIKKENAMATKSPKEVFLLLLSEARQNSERATKVFQEINQLVEDQDIKEAIDARVFVSEKILSQIDQCFKLLGEKPVALSGRLQEVFVEDFRRELAEIQSPTARQMFALAKFSNLVHFRIAEYTALAAIADLTGHFGIGVLLESCLADTMVFVERTRRLLRNLIESKVTGRLAA
jgi:ferritin-like metal-binding protein YciE